MTTNSTTDEDHEMQLKAVEKLQLFFVEIFLANWFVGWRMSLQHVVMSSEQFYKHMSDAFISHSSVIQYI